MNRSLVAKPVVQKQHEKYALSGKYWHPAVYIAHEKLFGEGNNIFNEYKILNFPFARTGKSVYHFVIYVWQLVSLASLMHLLGILPMILYLNFINLRT